MTAKARYAASIALAAKHHIACGKGAVMGLVPLLIVGLVIPPLLVGSAIFADFATLRGYGLALLSLVLLGLAIWVIVGIEQAVDRMADSGGGGLGTAVGVAFLLTVGIYLILLLWLGALIEAGMARHWWWLAGIFVAVLLPGLNLVIALSKPHPRDFDIITEYPPFLVLIFLPILTVLAYGVFRCVRPVQPATARQATPAR